MRNVFDVIYFQTIRLHIYLNTVKTFVDKSLLVSKTFPGFSSLGAQNCFLFKVRLQGFSQFCTSREGNPGNVLLTSSISISEKSISRDNICFHMKLYYNTRDAIQLEAIDILLNLRYVTWVLGKLTVLIRSGTYVGNAK